MSYGSRDNCACPSFSDVLTKKYAQTQARVVELGTCIQRVPRVQKKKRFSISIVNSRDVRKEKEIGKRRLRLSFVPVIFFFQSKDFNANRKARRYF